MIEGLADLPRQALGEGLALAIAPGEIDADRVAVDRLERARDRKVAAAVADRDDELDLVLQIVGAGRIGHPRTIGHDRVGGLLEEERRIALVTLLHLADVLEIVAPDAVDATHGERSIVSGDGDDGRSRRGRRRGTPRSAHGFILLCIHRQGRRACASPLRAVRNPGCAALWRSVRPRSLVLSFSFLAPLRALRRQSCIQIACCQLELYTRMFQEGSMNAKVDERDGAARPVSASTTERLRAAVLAGEFRPGERLYEERLSARLGVSRTPIRDRK